jgi:phosphocarrier protein HPr
VPSRTVIVGSSVGLHARPAALIAQAAVNAGVGVTLAVEGGDPVDAGSALMIMTLGAGCGTPVTVFAENEDVLDSIADLVQKDLDS